MLSSPAQPRHLQGIYTMLHCSSSLLLKNVVRLGCKLCESSKSVHLSSVFNATDS